MTDKRKDPTNAERQARHRAKTKVKLKSFAELLEALKKQTEASQELIEEIEGKEDDR